MAKQQGREMVDEARAYRERVLGELSRRRELARQQIEQLVHGRDRLLQAFERARLVAVDVVAEMTPVGEPDEYVDLSPTTGPVPIMVPATAAQAARMADASAIDDSVLRPVEDVRVFDDAEAVEMDEELAEVVDIVQVVEVVESSRSSSPTPSMLPTRSTTRTSPRATWPICSPASAPIDRRPTSARMNKPRPRQTPASPR